jgi:hypothetical protein
MTIKYDDSSEMHITHATKKLQFFILSDDDVDSIILRLSIYQLCNFCQFLYAVYPAKSHRHVCERSYYIFIFHFLFLNFNVIALQKKKMHLNYTRRDAIL